MVTQFLKVIHPHRWFYAFIFIHVFVWTIAPTITRYTLPMDAMEGAIWGHQLEWGYDKNPFMNSWLTALAIKIGGYSGWPVYLFSQISVAICFWAVWQLGKKMLPPLYAVLGVLLLEGVQYYNLHAIDFNDNTLELGTWALTILFFYQALREKKISDWMLTGLFAGLAMMTKYYTVLLLLPMTLFMLFNHNNRQQFKRLPFYYGLLTFLVIIAPHIIWLTIHDFVTVNYAFDRISSPPEWQNHFFYPAQFAWQQFETFLPVFFLLAFLFIGKKSTLIQPQIKINDFDKQFLLYVGFGPLFLTILLSALTGIKLRAAWGQPLLSLWGIIVIIWLQPNITPSKFYRFVAVLFSLLAVTVASYCISLIRADAPSSANFPGKNIAAELTKTWHEKYNTPLHYVAGSRWIAGNIAFYSTDHPSVYINWNKQISPWIDEVKLKRDGAVFIWDPTEDQEANPKEIAKRFADLQQPALMQFMWLRNNSMAPVAVLVAFLPPNKKTIDSPIN
jgi:4-amino-4-deoxy-L-arabinose transferase-like glycosyltransferase